MRYLTAPPTDTPKSPVEVKIACDLAAPLSFSFVMNQSCDQLDVSGICGVTGARCACRCVRGTVSILWMTVILNPEGSVKEVRPFHTWD